MSTDSSQGDAPSAPHTKRTKAGKSLIVFSDGTGNSSAKLQKTNVWRLYQAVDTSDPSDESMPRQLVLYDNGVGTSSFKPLALLGGAFGVGLRRNVLDLYRFLCRHYEPGDKIYAFGFSRGAFTIRVLIGFICEAGLIDVRHGSDRSGMPEAELNALSGDAYRNFRRCFQVSGITAPLVTGLRNLRDQMRRWTRGNHTPTLDGNVIQVADDAIAFVGVWDTVAAYGAPVAEITRGIDRWIWPLSMPNYHLNPKVQCARHALALDDERDTFHPLLWDEVHEQTLIDKKLVTPERLRQVWFSGMHSDVGGGYSDESLAYVSLLWMIEELSSKEVRLHEASVLEIKRIANALGPMHDSRSGLATYYRYQPRRISARMNPPDRMTRIVQDPALDGKGLLHQVRIHASVLKRIRSGVEGYAPIVLPDKYLVEGEGEGQGQGQGQAQGRLAERHAEHRASAQEAVWDDVWKRRVSYFTTLFLTLLLVSMPLLPDEPRAACTGVRCAWEWLFGALRWLLPNFLSPWIDSFEARPLVFSVVVGCIAVAMKWTSATEVRIRDRMRALLRQSFAAKWSNDGVVAPGKIRRLRASNGYQGVVRFMKWHLGPVAAATVISMALVTAVGIALFLVLGSLHRFHMAIAENSDSYCEAAAQATAVFSTNDPCWRTGTNVTKDKRYQMQIRLLNDWADGRIEASPEGFWSERLAWWLRLPAVLLRRSMDDPWFRPLLRIEGHRSFWSATTPLPMKLASSDQRLYFAEFTAPADGQVILSVNDAIWLWGLDRRFFYRQSDGGNFGTAEVSVKVVD